MADEVGTMKMDAFGRECLVLPRPGDDGYHNDVGSKLNPSSFWEGGEESIRLSDRQDLIIVTGQTKWTGFHLPRARYYVRCARPSEIPKSGQ